MGKKTDIAERVAAEVEAGRAWRAREILRGRVRHSYDREVYALYGRVLRDLGEEMEAGKYLLLSGVDSEEDSAAVELFLGRHARASANQLVMTFPSAARWRVAELYPERLGAELGRRKYRPPKERLRGGERDSWRSCVGSALVALAMLAFLAAAAYGFIEAVRWLIGRL